MANTQDTNVLYPPKNTYYEDLHKLVKEVDKWMEYRLEYERNEHVYPDYYDTDFGRKWKKEVIVKLDEAIGRLHGWLRA